MVGYNYQVIIYGEIELQAIYLSTSVYISDWLIDNYQLVILIVITGGTKNIGRLTCYMYNMRIFIS